MKICYSLTFKEFMHSQVLGLRQMTRQEGVKVLGIFGFLLLLTALSHVYHAYREPYYLPVDFYKDEILLGICVPLALICGFLCWPLEGLKQKLEIRPEGIVLKRNFVSIQMPWNVTRVLDEDDGFIYMTFLDKRFKIKGASSVGLVIPKRAFASAEEAEKFYQQAQLYCREAGGKPTASVWAGGSLPAAR